MGQDFKKLAEALVAQMTLEEKASQLRYDAPAIPRLGIPAYNWWNEAAHGVARAGTATVFPQNIGISATFDAPLAHRIGETVSTEARAKFNMQSALGDRDIYKGLTFWAPNVHSFRDPRWGRGQETYGEDPYLTARMGVSYVRGIQGEGKYLRAAACAKHFAVHSGPERVRHEFDADVSEKDLRETYLAAFEALVKEAKVEAVMGAYNRFRGDPCCGSKLLLKKILRGEWGFDGHVVSDCGALSDFHRFHHVTATAPQSAAMAMEAGCDVNCGNTYLHILQAHQDGLVTEEQITRAAVRLMTTRMRLGLFDSDCEYDAIPYSENDTDAHAQLALETARESIVLLKNDGILPARLDQLRSVAVIGPNANSIVALEGNYNGTSSRYVTLLEGIRAACAEAGVRVYYSEGSHLYRERVEDLALPGDRIAEAKYLAQNCDLVILCVGLDSTIEGEEGVSGSYTDSGDKRDLELPECQRRLIRAVESTGKPFVTVITAGSALHVEAGNAILQAWYPGQAGGTVLAEILFGRVSPSGRLPVTFVRSADELPAFTDYSMKNRTYRYIEGEALYPFGFGLSYAEFEYRNAEIRDGAVYVAVKNAGDMPAGEVTELYVKRPDSPFDARNASLCGFTRTFLAPGEEREIAIPIPETTFEVINEAGERVSGGKRFVFYVGSSQPDPVSVRLVGRAPIELHYERK